MSLVTEVVKTFGFFCSPDLLCSRVSVTLVSVIFFVDYGFKTLEFRSPGPNSKRSFCD